MCEHNPAEANIEDDDNKDPLAFPRKMAALAKRGGDAPETLTLEEIQELCLTLEIHYTREGIS